MTMVFDDGAEESMQSDPKDACDPDDDSDACEAQEADTDGDTFTNDEEVELGSDPLDPCDPSVSSPLAIRTTMASPMPKRPPLEPTHRRRQRQVME